MNEAAFSNCNAEDYINVDKDVQTEPDFSGKMFWSLEIPFKIGFTVSRLHFSCIVLDIIQI